MPTLLKWQQAWQSLGVPPSKIPIQGYDEIITCYNQAHRYYHTHQHLAECLQKLAGLRHLAINPAEIELALWFHDAVYDPLRQDNEQLSAEWARSSVVNSGLDTVVAERVYNLVMATEHHTKLDDIDTKILIDADIAILAANTARYKQYEQQIRQEYAHVPEEIFRDKRAGILRKFLTQPTIFNTQVFVERYEKKARSNIKFALEVLCLI